MQQTFIQTVQAYTLKFNRLLYPIRYTILSQDPLHFGIVILAEKDSEGI